MVHKHTVSQIIRNPIDYKVCKICGAINLYDNVFCHRCHNDCAFIDRHHEVEKAVINLNKSSNYLMEV